MNNILNIEELLDIHILQEENLLDKCFCEWL